MSSTELTFQPDMSVLKADALQNIKPILATEVVSQPDMSALKADAPQNIYSMSVTELTSQPDMFALNDQALENIYCMSVTELTSQPSISSDPAGPQFAVSQHTPPVALTAKQLSTAVLSWSLLVNGAPCAYPTTARRKRASTCLYWCIFFLGEEGSCACGLCGSSDIFQCLRDLGRVGVPYIFLGHKDTNTLLS